jgi:hypothetical protein
MAADLVADLVAQFDPVSFARRCGVDPYDWQIDALRSVAPREAWVIGRQCGKSTTAGLLAVHTALYRPGSTTLLVSPGQRQSGELFAKARYFYKVLGRPAGAVSEAQTTLETEAGSRIIAVPGGTGGATLRSYSADLILIDEAAQVDDATYTAVRPMVATRQGRIILLSTPWGREGFYADAATGADAGWVIREVSAHDILDRAFLDRERASMTATDYQREYENSFEALTAGIWSEAQWNALSDPSVVSLAARLAAFTGGSDA